MVIPFPTLQQLQKNNRLRWLFYVLLVIVIGFVLQDSAHTLPWLLLWSSVVFASLLIFEWVFCELIRRKDEFLGAQTVRLIIFGQVVIDIVFISFATSLTGGTESLVPLVYVLYFGVLELTFSPSTLAGLNLLGIFSYLIVAHASLLDWSWAGFFQDARGFHFANQSSYQVMLFVVSVLILNAFLVIWRSAQIRRQWLAMEADNTFLTNLNLLSRTAISDVNDKTAFVGLADAIKVLLKADNIYLTHWDEETAQVLSLAADSSVHAAYMQTPPTPRYENTFTRSVKRAGRLVIAENAFCSPYVSPRVAQFFKSSAVLAAPMFGNPDHRFLGALLVSFSSPHEFSAQELARTRQVIDILSLLISRIWFHEEAMHRAELLEKMAGQVTDLVSDLKHTTLLPSIVESARSLLQAQRAALHLQRDDGQMNCEYSVGLSNEFLSQLTQRFNQLAGGSLLKNKDFVVIPDVKQDSRTSPVQDLIFGEKFRAYAVFSLDPGDGQKGALSLYWDQPYVVSAGEISVGKLFADRASAIIRSADIYARATEDALTDILTGLPNRRHLDQRMRDEIERATRYEHTFALLMIDLDGFKGINDTFGHPIGDGVLKQVSDALRRSLRSSDFLARYGGDEFSIILPETGLERALMVAEKLRMGLASTRLHLPQQTQRYLSGCMGVAIFPNDRLSAEEMIVCADQRMYRAKRSGSGSVVSADE